MHSSILKWTSFLSLAALALSAPVSKRGFNYPPVSQSPPPSNFGVGQYGFFNGFSPEINDVNILQFALMLEVEQTLFYQTGFSQFTVDEMIEAGLSVEEVTEFQTAFVIEQTHVNTLVSVLEGLGQSPLNQPEFYFSFESPVDFVEQIAVQEQIATDAYLGAAGLISSNQVLTEAASIMVVEARQSSFANSVLGSDAFSSPFETGLSLEQVVNLVAPLIVSIPDNTILQVLGFDVNSFALQQTSITAFQEVSISSTFSFSYSGGEEITPPENVNQLYCAFIEGSQSYFTEYTPGSGCEISNQLEVGEVVVVQLTVSESISVDQLFTAPQYIQLFP